MVYIIYGTHVKILDMVNHDIQDTKKDIGSIHNIQEISECSKDKRKKLHEEKDIGQFYRCLE